ncbi:XP_034969460.1uncharacterized protein LOC118084187, partial [Podarcis lilfordi]
HIRFRITSAALFNDAQFSGTGPSSQAVAAAVHTRSWAHLASSGPQNSIGLPAQRPPACVNNPVASSSFSPSQNKQPRVQLPESGTSSAGEEEQQLEGELQTAEVAVIPYVEKKPFDSYCIGKPDLRGEPKRKVCWEFNKGSCQGQSCKYPHECERCAGVHPAAACYKEKQPFQGGRGFHHSSSRGAPAAGNRR